MYSPVICCLLYLLFMQILTEGREMIAIAVTGTMLGILTAGGKETGEKGIDARNLTKTMERKGEEEAVHLLKTGKGGDDRSEVCGQV